MHFEVELGLVMGKGLRDLDAADEQGAMSAISSKLKLWIRDGSCAVLTLRSRLPPHHRYDCAQRSGRS